MFTNLNNSISENQSILDCLLILSWRHLYFISWKHYFLSFIFNFYLQICHAKFALIYENSLQLLLLLMICGSDSNPVVMINKNLNFSCGWNPGFYFFLRKGSHRLIEGMGPCLCIVSFFTQMCIGKSHDTNFDLRSLVGTWEDMNIQKK